MSRVLNSSKSVDPGYRKRVERAARKLGYVINHAARALRSRRSRVVGAVIPTLNYALYARLVEALEQRLRRSGYALLLATSEYDLQSELAHARILLERGAEGLILVGAKHHHEIWRVLNTYGAKAVNTYVFDPKGKHSSVGFDNGEAAIELVRHLIQLGHRRFGVISGILKDNDRTQGRLDGVRSELRRHNIELAPELIIERPYRIDGGRDAMRILLANRQGCPTAIVCSNDILAIGAIIECRERELTIPQHISIVGFDNIELASQMQPALTTIDIPACEMGTKAAEQLLNEISERPGTRHHRVEVRLVVRGTTAPPPATSSWRAPNSGSLEPVEAGSK